MVFYYRIVHQDVLFVLVNPLGKFRWSNEHIGSWEIPTKDSNTLPSSFLKGRKPLKSMLMIFSSLADDLCGCDDDFVWMFTCCSNPSTILVTPPEALLAQAIALSVLFAPIALISFFISQFLFSWNRSISMFLPAPPFQFTVAAHLQWLASACDSRTSHCRMLINISIANSLNPGVAKKCLNSCFLMIHRWSPLPVETASLKSASNI